MTTVKYWWAKALLGSGILAVLSKWWSYRLLPNKRRKEDIDQQEREYQQMIDAFKMLKKAYFENDKEMLLMAERHRNIIKERNLLLVQIEELKFENKKLQSKLTERKQLGNGEENKESD